MANNAPKKKKKKVEQTHATLFVQADGESYPLDFKPNGGRSYF